MAWSYIYIYMYSPAKTNILNSQTPVHDAARENSWSYWLTFWDFGLSKNKDTFSPIDTITHFESMWLIKMYLFSIKPMIQKVSQPGSIFSLRICGRMGYLFPFLTADGATVICSNKDAFSHLSLGQRFLTWVRSNPRGSVNQFQGFGDLVHPVRLCTNTVYSYIHMFWIWKKKSNYERVDECMYGTCGVQYPQKC